LKNILIIDDSALMRRIISDIINSDEELHSERTATNGLEAINMLESGQRLYHFRYKYAKDEWY
jgi:two-component system chemotaxis response regulator CheB